jgi:hypothetical protein
MAVRRRASQAGVCRALAIIRQNLCLGRRAVKRYQRPLASAPIAPQLDRGLFVLSITCVRPAGVSSDGAERGPDFPIA